VHLFDAVHTTQSGFNSANAVVTRHPGDADVVRFKDARASDIFVFIHKFLD